MTQKEVSVKKLENIQEQTTEWLEGFMESVHYKALPTTVESQVSTIVMNYATWMYKEEERGARKWTATATENILTKVFPRELSNFKELEGAIVPVLTAFFNFLEENSKISNSQTLIRKLEKLPLESKEIVVQTSPKKATETSKADYSQEEIRQFNRFSMGQVATSNVTSDPVMPNRKIGRNEPCPCGSGKKYKKCHGR